MGNSRYNLLLFLKQKWNNDYLYSPWGKAETSNTGTLKKPGPSKQEHQKIVEKWVSGKNSNIKSSPLFKYLFTGLIIPQNRS
jgi:hypothetical protein